MMNFSVFLGLAIIAIVLVSADDAISESTSRITDILSAAEKQRWMTTLKMMREDVAQHDTEVDRAKMEVAQHDTEVDRAKMEVAQPEVNVAQPKVGNGPRRNLTEIIGGVFGRIADAQKQYEQAQLVLVGFTYDDCSGASDPVHLRSLTVSPDPIPLPGKIIVAASAEVAESIAGNLKTSVILETEIFGHFFKIPCVDNVGSCDYDHLCSLLPKPEEPCPPPFVHAGIPCRCPFPAGKFNLPTSALMLPSVPLPIHSATIRFTAHVTLDGKPITCVQLRARVEKKD